MIASINNEDIRDYRFSEQTISVNQDSDEVNITKYFATVRVANTSATTGSVIKNVNIDSNLFGCRLTFTDLNTVNYYQGSISLEFSNSHIVTLLTNGGYFSDTVVLDFTSPVAFSPTFCGILDLYVAGTHTYGKLTVLFEYITPRSLAKFRKS